jgi:two-component system sensor histidine kinase KdpD
MTIKHQEAVSSKQKPAQVDARPLPSRQIVQHIAIMPPRRRSWLRYRVGSSSEPLSHLLIGYAAAVLGVTAASLCIGIVLAFVHVENLSLVYLPVILWLAVSFGRGPAITASFLASVAYDFFFVPPFYRLTVADPTQWISLLALLATALVIGQLTANAQAHANEALASQQRTTRLYALAQMIASTTDEERLLYALAHRVVEVFRSTGMKAAALLLPDTDGNLLTRAVAPPDEKRLEALSLEIREQASLAKWALLHGGAVGRDITKDKDAECTIFYVPLWSGGRVIGILGIAGTHAIHGLVTGMSIPETKGAPGTVVYKPDDPQAQLFAAFCGQIALALDRATLQQQAIHAGALRESDRLKNVLPGSVTHEITSKLNMS